MRLVAIATLAGFVAACGAEPSQSTPFRKAGESGASRGGTSKTDDELNPEPTNPGDGADMPPSGELDADGDGIPNDKDCAPQDAAVVGTRLLDEALTQDRQQFATATGFSAASWSYVGNAYAQTRLADASDATFFAGDADISNVDVEVRAASTEVTAITPRLRQLFILLGAKSENGSFEAYGCGIEVVQGLAPEQRTSIVKLSGDASGVTTTPVQRMPRTAVQAGEDFTIRALVKDGTITCTASQGLDVVTTATAPNVGEVRGSVGFFTRQTKAAYKAAKICKLK